ncbi:MAG: hypothetical protein V4725_04680 [Bacteroidota bacterium]
MKTLTSKIIAVAITSFVLTANVATAQAINASYSVKAAEPLTVKYLGSDENYLVFEVTVNPTDSKSAVLGVSDKTEGELYAENLKSAGKTQKLKIEKRDSQELNFKLSVGANTYNKSFSINTSRVENTVVSEKDITVL